MMKNPQIGKSRHYCPSCFKETSLICFKQFDLISIVLVLREVRGQSALAYNSLFHVQQQILVCSSAQLFNGRYGDGQ